MLLPKRKTSTRSRTTAPLLAMSRSSKLLNGMSLLLIPNISLSNIFIFRLKNGLWSIRAHLPSCFLRNNSISFLVRKGDIGRGHTHGKTFNAFPEFWKSAIKSITSQLSTLNQSSRFRNSSASVLKKQKSSKQNLMGRPSILISFGLDPTLLDRKETKRASK